MLYLLQTANACTDIFDKKEWQLGCISANVSDACYLGRQTRSVVTCRQLGSMRPEACFQFASGCSSVTAPQNFDAISAIDLLQKIFSFGDSVMTGIKSDLVLYCPNFVFRRFMRYKSYNLRQPPIVCHLANMNFF